MEDLSCQRFTDLLSDFVEGRVPPEELRAMDAHRLACARCSELLADYERIPGVVRRATDASMPAGAKARLRRLLSRAWSWHR
jgi:anti-sigma factor RsiW